MRVDDLRTERLSLRRWRTEDLEPFARVNADGRVCEFLPRPLTRAESDAVVERMEAHFDRHGFGLWCVESLRSPGCLGFVGLSVPRFDAHFTPAVEVGWRLDPAVWGLGYATEAAVACLDAAFDVIGLDEVVSFTVPANRRSRAVMERLGMVHDPTDDFDHPVLAPDDPLRRHVLYRLEADAWRQRSTR